MTFQHTNPPAPEPASHYRGYPLSVLLALDRLGNALAGGVDTETVSGRLGRAMASGRLGESYACGWPRLIRRHCLWVYGVLPVLPCSVAMNR